MESQRNRNHVGEIGRSVASNIRRLRTVRALSTRDLSALLGEHGRPIPATGITRIEKFARTVDVDDLTAFAQALSVTPEILLSPSSCDICKGEPPAGFSCRTCGAESDTQGAPKADNERAAPTDRDLIPWWPDAASRLGGVGRTTMYRLVSSGELPSVTIRRRRFVATTDLDQYIERLRSGAES